MRSIYLLIFILLINCAPVLHSPMSEVIMTKDNKNLNNKFGLGLSSTISFNLENKITQETDKIFNSDRTVENVHPLNNKLEGYGIGFLFMFNKNSSLSISFGKSVIGLDYTQYLIKNIYITGILTAYGLGEVIIQKQLKISNWYMISLGPYFRYDKYFIDYDLPGAHPQMKFGPSSSFSSNSIGVRLSSIFNKHDKINSNYSIALINSHVGYSVLFDNYYTIIGVSLCIN